MVTSIFIAIVTKKLSRQCFVSGRNISSRYYHHYVFRINVGSALRVNGPSHVSIRLLSSTSKIPSTKKTLFDRFMTILHPKTLIEKVLRGIDWCRESHQRQLIGPNKTKKRIEDDNYRQCTAWGLNLPFMKPTKRQPGTLILVRHSTNSEAPARSPAFRHSIT